MTAISTSDWFSRGIADLFPADAEITLNNKPLRVKLGIDPTGSSIHLGHSILFRKLRAFQDAGHTAVLIIGDFTARIGDPTGKSATRVQLSTEEVESNATTYLEQLGLGKDPKQALLDFQTPGRLEVRRNSEWLVDLNLPKVIELLALSTVGQMLAKEEFANRYENGTAISLHEFLYPLLQGFDSVAIRADLELGGTDQKFNVAMGRDLQRHFGLKPQVGLLLPILPGLDGVQKMSKSLGNTVALNEDPLSMYSKLEKVPDAVVDQYLTLLTDLDLGTLPENPRQRQRAMALEITRLRHGDQAAAAAQADAASLIAGAAGGEAAAAEMPEVVLAYVKFPAKAFYLLSAVGVCSSSSDARRQIKGGALRIDGMKLTNPEQEFTNAEELRGKVLQLGKKIFRRFA